MEKEPNKFLIDLQLDPVEQKDLAAIKIQSLFRSFQAKKVYLDLLFEDYDKEMNKLEEFNKAQTEQNLISLKRQEFLRREQEELFLKRQKTLQSISSATKIQRAWRKHKANANYFPQSTYKRPQTAASRLKQHTKNLVIFNLPPEFEDDDNDDYLQSNKSNYESASIHQRSNTLKISQSKNLLQDDKKQQEESSDSEISLDEDIEDQGYRQQYQELIRQRQRLIKEREQKQRRYLRTQASSIYSRKQLADGLNDDEIKDDQLKFGIDIDDINIKFQRSQTTAKFNSQKPPRMSVSDNLLNKRRNTIAKGQKNIANKEKQESKQQQIQEQIKYSRYDLQKKSVIQLKIIREKLEKQLALRSFHLKEFLEERETLNQQNQRLFHGMRNLIQRLRSTAM